MPKNNKLYETTIFKSKRIILECIKNKKKTNKILNHLLPVVDMKYIYEYPFVVDLKTGDSISWEHGNIKIVVRRLTEHECDKYIKNENITNVFLSDLLSGEIGCRVNIKWIGIEDIDKLIIKSREEVAEFIESNYSNIEYWTYDKITEVDIFMNKQYDSGKSNS